MWISTKNILHRCLWRNACCQPATCHNSISSDSASSGCSSRIAHTHELTHWAECYWPNATSRSRVECIILTRKAELYIGARSSRDQAAPAPVLTTLISSSPPDVCLSAMDPKYSAKLLPIRSKEIRSPLEQQQAGPSKSSFRTTTPRPGSENVSARSDLKDGRHARESPRGHDYSNVQAQDYARMHLGDTYTAKTMIFQQLRHPTGTEEDDKQIGLLEALAFENMNTRIDSISAPQGDTCRWLFKTEQYRS